MSTKRDLVEAHGYNRRRLVTAFVSGAPGGREVEPVRQGRTVIGGVVLAVMVVAGAAVSGFLQTPPPSDWEDQKIVIGEPSGSRFYTRGDEVFPVINPTSARLLQGEEVDPYFIDDELLADKVPGPSIGISGAPEVLPPVSGLVEQGWGACTNSSGGIRISLGGAQPPEPATDEALLVTDQGQAWLITGGSRYALGEAEQAELVLRRLGLADREPTPVTGLWLNLFTQGSPLEVPEVAGGGGAVDTGIAELRVAGTPVELPTGTYVLAQDGDLVPTSEFAHLVLQSTTDAVELEAGAADALEIDTAAVAATFPADWPESAVTPYTAPESPCIRMDVGENEAPTLALANGSGDQLPSGSDLTHSFAPNTGGVLRAVSGNVLDSGNVYLVDSSGTAFPVGEEADGAELSLLGYSGYAPRPIPQPWLSVMGQGPALSTVAAASEPVPLQEVAASGEGQ